MRWHASKGVWPNKWPWFWWNAGGTLVMEGGNQLVDQQMCFWWMWIWQIWIWIIMSMCFCFSKLDCHWWKPVAITTSGWVQESSWFLLARDGQWRCGGQAIWTPWRQAISLKCLERPAVVCNAPSDRKDGLFEWSCNDYHSGSKPGNEQPQL